MICCLTWNKWEHELNFLVIMYLFFFSKTFSTSCCFAMMFFGYLNVMSLKYTIEQVVKWMILSFPVVYVMFAITLVVCLFVHIKYSRKTLYLVRRKEKKETS